MAAVTDGKRDESFLIGASAMNAFFRHDIVVFEDLFFFIIALFSLSPGFCVLCSSLDNYAGIFLFQVQRISFCPPFNVRGKCSVP